MEISKIKSYVGFAIKAGKVVYGVDNITELRHKPPLVLFDKSLSENSKERLLRYLDNQNVTAIEFEIENVLSQKNCKALALKEKHLAEAIISEIKEN